ncbi:MAG: hypothetical protein A2234_05205 [Elusimicrobia bacterium RIFOXYA2_FULL_58_8]|nr:MAG: hypothetical protein A2234_05205 [Elusimicrobia bacterium RIFOXYA2_FULL_58_8]OGS14353.1 MAG: hypothetical protein A2285_06680 [Elusimicrobia bacterium RIFOXYA12_FULL_57_11]
MQNNLSEEGQKGPGKAVKYVLIAFVAVSIGAAVYKMLPCCSGDKAQAAPVETAAAAPVQAEKTEAKAAAAPIKAKAVKTAEAKIAVVYYFYTNTRCSSCKTIEAYTRDAVATKLAAGYKDWKIEFKGVNIEEAPNEHFAQDYWLNSKSVVVQKFAGEKALNWGKLDKVWQLLGDKDAFMNYVTDETHKLLDSK